MPAPPRHDHGHDLGARGDGVEPSRLDAHARKLEELADRDDLDGLHREICAVRNTLSMSCRRWTAVSIGCPSDEVRDLLGLCRGLLGRVDELLCGNAPSDLGSQRVHRQGSDAVAECFCAPSAVALGDELRALARQLLHLDSPLRADRGASYRMAVRDQLV